MRYTKSTIIIIFLIGFVTLIPVNVVYATDASQYVAMLEQIDSLSLILKDKFKADVEGNWNATSQLQQYTVKNILNSIDGLEEIYQQKNYPEIIDSLRDLRASLRQVETMKQITTYQNEIKYLEQSIDILISSNKIKQMLRYNEILDSKIYLHYIWEPIHAKIKESKTVDDVLSFQTDVENMGKIIKYNSRINENTHSPVFIIIDPHVKSVWDNFKKEMSQSQSITDMTKIATKYHGKVGKIDDKIISKWEVKITTLKNDAKKQENIQDLMLIEQNIKNLNMVKKIEKNSNPFDNDVQSKAILHNISQNYLKIKSDLKEYSLYLDNKNQMEQKVIQLQNKANDKSHLEKMPEFESKIKNTLKRVSNIKNALELNDFRYAQQLLDAVEQEWINFERFYPEIRNYTPIYKQHDISTAQKKQIYLNQISQIDTLVSSLNINHTSVDYQKYHKSIRESKASILYGNFEVGHKKIYKIIDFASQKFLPHDPRIMMDILYDSDSNLLTIKGAVYKHSLNSRDKVSFYLFNQNNEIVELNSRTTKYGDFQILWNSDIKSGLYIAEIHHGSAKESQIISIQDDDLQSMVFNSDEIAIMEIANTFESLESFVKKFTNSGSEKQLWKIQLLINKIKQDLTGGKIQSATESIQQFKNNIKLYLSIQSPEIVIDASAINSTVKITGKIAKLVEYREPIFLTIFDQDGKRMYEQMSYDDKYGNINIEIPKHILKGFMVIQIEYHDSLARDIIEIS